MLAYVFRDLGGREGADELLTRLGHLAWGWWAAAVAMQLTAIGFAIVRWRLLLRGQGIVAPWRFLVGSFFIGRFWGAFTPGGYGLDGWRLYDVAARTRKVARATAVTGVEKVLGQLGFGIVVLVGSIWGLEMLGTAGVLLVNGLFVVLVTTGMTLLARPKLFRWLAQWLPAPVRVRVQTLVDAVCAYHGKIGLLARAVGLGVLVHAFNNLIYVCAARAIGVELGVGVVFFASSLQIMSTLLPASINGIGLREMSAVALYTLPAVGLTRATAVLIPLVGFAAEMAVSACGTIPFLLRRGGYRDDIVVEDEHREDAAHAAIEEVAPEEWPRRARGLVLGLEAGLLAGVLIGLGEGVAVIEGAGGHIGYGVLSYGAVAYGILQLLGGAFGLALAWSGRLMKRRAMKESHAYARITAVIVAVVALGLGAFRIRRDLYHEELVWKSLHGLGVAALCLAGAVVLYLALSATLRFLLSSTPARVMLRSWGSPAVLGVLVGVVALVTVLFGGPASASPGGTHARAPDGAPNVLVIVVDTVRADYLPAWGNDRIAMPNLDAFAEDAIRFDQAFSNASWTRPSFASILTGRHPSSHGVMAKADQLPDELVTLPEALSGGGYHTTGFVTNFNVAPYFNFQQGFDEYDYLEPDFVLGADDAASKLLLVQSLRQGIEKVNAMLGIVRPGSAYQDAATVNRAVFSWLDRAPDSPWFLFTAYMDPHDPYFAHPYSGNGYARAAHQEPDLAEAAHLRELYEGELVYWDGELGHLLAELRRRGLYDDMTIVITADHGEEIGDHGGFWHGTTLYDEAVHVPLYVKLPGARRGGTVLHHWVQSIDIAPTILSQVGIDVPDGVQGGDLFEGTDVVYAEESHEGNVLQSVRQRRGMDEWKLITANPRNPRGLEAIELYRPDLDVHERDNLADDHEEDLHAVGGTLVDQAERARAGAVESHTVDITLDPTVAGQIPSARLRLGRRRPLIRSQPRRRRPSASAPATHATASHCAVSPPGRATPQPHPPPPPNVNGSRPPGPVPPSLLALPESPAIAPASTTPTVPRSIRHLLSPSRGSCATLLAKPVKVPSAAPMTANGISTSYVAPGASCASALAHQR